ncbi:hypothetical protein MTP99_013435 [Tenebrio molitor]|nr:hypothetical protein MTP99_013435 [Tenebrio molitor]
MLKRAVVFVMLLSVCASQEESQAEATTVVMLEKDPEEKFDFTKFDYCSIKCGEDKHSACDCKMRGPRTYLSDDLVQFRQDILDKHNELRNMLASGQEPKMGGKTASNMMVLNYDLELEYIAQCYGGYFVKSHDNCRLAHDKTKVGQNLAGRSSIVPNYHMNSMERWYNEIRFLEGPELFKPYTGSKTPAGIIGHFVQLVWASMYRVGCVRIWNPENTLNVYKWVLICNYKAGPGGTSANILDAQIFGEGEPCSNCLYNTQCNDKYSSLCGKLYPAPTDPVTELPTDSGSERLVPTHIKSLCVFVALLYFC